MCSIPGRGSARRGVSGRALGGHRWNSSPTLVGMDDTRAPQPTQLMPYAIDPGIGDSVIVAVHIAITTQTTHGGSAGECHVDRCQCRVSSRVGRRGRMKARCEAPSQPPQARQVASSGWARYWLQGPARRRFYDLPLATDQDGATSVQRPTQAWGSGSWADQGNVCR